MIQRILIFLLINFGALALGGIFAGQGASSDWYQNLNKAPWTPPGWVFGVAWTAIMIAFSVYMDYLYGQVENKTQLGILFGIQWILNVAWNPAFFYFHQPMIGLIIISALTLLVLFFLIWYWKDLTWYSAFLLPYLIWLLIATSLNSYIVFNN
mgnify:CR=1 FL=1